MTGVILTKVANMLVEDAELAVPRAVEAAVEAVGGSLDPVDVVLDAFRRHYGGLWVGGRMTLTADALRFTPNGVNRAFHRDLTEVVIGLRDVVGVEVLPGFLTKIIAVRVPGHVAKLRCYGAPAVAEKIRAAAR